MHQIVLTLFRVEGRDVAREGLGTGVWINGDVRGTLMTDADRDTR
jgi:hypothetical protein